MASEGSTGNARQDTKQRHPPTHDRHGLVWGPVEKLPLVREVHLQAQLEGPAGNREALVHACSDSSRGSGPIVLIEKTGRWSCGNSMHMVALG